MNNTIINRVNTAKFYEICSQISYSKTPSYQGAHANEKKETRKGKKSFKHKISSNRCIKIGSNLSLIGPWKLQKQFQNNKKR